MSIIAVPCTSLLLLHISPLTPNPDVNIGFAQMAYTTPEEDPNGQGSTVQVCIVLMGALDDDVEVVLTTMSGSAIGDTIMLHIFPYFHALYFCELRTSQGFAASQMKNSFS